MIKISTQEFLIMLFLIKHTRLIKMLSFKILRLIDRKKTHSKLEKRETRTSFKQILQEKRTFVPKQIVI